MTRNSIIAAACVVAIHSIACGNDTVNTANTGAGGNASVADASAGGAMNLGGVSARDAGNPTALELSGDLSDVDMLNVVKAISAGEVDQARIAQNRAKNPAVRAFASKMINDHTLVGYSAAVVANSMGTTPTSNEVAGMVTRAGDVAIQVMNATPKSGDFDRTYLQVQIDEQKNVLAVIERMLQNADSDGVRTFFTTARIGIERDFAEATRILASLG